MTIFVLFFIELMAMRYATFGHDHSAEHSHHPPSGVMTPDSLPSDRKPSIQRHTPGEDHLSHTRDHIENDDIEIARDDTTAPQGAHLAHIEDYAAQMTGTFPTPILNSRSICKRLIPNPTSSNPNPGIRPPLPQHLCRPDACRNLLHHLPSPLRRPHLPPNIRRSGSRLAPNRNPLAQNLPAYTLLLRPRLWLQHTACHRHRPRCTQKL